MGTVGLDLALIALLIAVNAVFSGSETALISLREGQIRRLERRGDRAARSLVRLAGDPNRFLATTQIAITLAGFLASATAAVSLARRLESVFGSAGAAAEPVAVAVVTIVLSFVTLVFGELAPKRLAMQHAKRWALLAARPLDVVSRLSRPLVWLLGACTDLAVRIVGGNPVSGREQVASEELRELVAAHRGLGPEQRTIMLGALDIGERILRDVLVPRRSVFTLKADIEVSQARSALAASGHSRAPVLPDGELDDAIGVVNLRDLIDHDGGLAEVMRPALVFPDSTDVSVALRRFLDEHEQFALVANEHGGIDGIATLEDLLEEVVGEIYDEADRDIAAVRRDTEGAMLLPGTFPAHDLPELGIRLDDAPPGDYSTVAGLVLAALGRIPRQSGDRVRLGEWTIEVVGINRHAITRIRTMRR